MADGAGASEGPRDPKVQQAPAVGRMPATPANPLHPSPATDGQRRQAGGQGRTSPPSARAANAGKRLLAWRLPGLPPGLGTFEWLGASSLRLPVGTIAALIATWTAILFALWVAVYSALGSVALLLTGTAASGHVAGIFTFTEHTGVSLDFIGVLTAFFAGLVFGFADSYTTTLNNGIPEVALAILIGIVLGVIIGLVSLLVEEPVLRARGYRRPSRREWETHLEPAVEAVQEAMGLTALPAFMIADSPMPLAWTVPRHVVVSTGLLQTLDASELQGVLAHELAHWRRGDPIALRMVWAFSWPLAALYWTGMVLSGARFGTPTSVEDVAAKQHTNSNMLAFLGWLILWPSYVLIRYLVGPATAHGSRQMEYEADAEAVRAGLGSGLLKALERLSPFEPGRTAWEAVLSASHPPMQLRIEAIEEVDPASESPEIVAASRHAAGWLFGICLILLVLTVSHLIPGPHLHPHQHSWWEWWKNW